MRTTRVFWDEEGDSELVSSFIQLPSYPVSLVSSLVLSGSVLPQEDDDEEDDEDHADYGMADMEAESTDGDGEEDDDDEEEE